MKKTEAKTSPLRREKLFLMVGGRAPTLPLRYGRAGGGLSTPPWKKIINYIVGLFSTFSPCTWGAFLLRFSLWWGGGGGGFFIT